jgi:hypothetical protein
MPWATRNARSATSISNSPVAGAHAVTTFSVQSQYLVNQEKNCLMHSMFTTISELPLFHEAACLTSSVILLGFKPILVLTGSVIRNVAPPFSLLVPLIVPP